VDRVTVVSASLRYVEAFDAARRAVELAPYAPSSHVAASFVALQVGDLPTAEATAGRAVALDPRSAPARRNLALPRRRQGTSDRERLRERIPRLFAILVLLAIAAFRLTTGDGVGFPIRIAQYWLVAGIAALWAVRRWQARSRSRAVLAESSGTDAGDL
jgi:hypothetical protein